MRGRIAVLAVLVVLFAGCSAGKHMTVETPVYIHDTTVSVKVVHDTCIIERFRTVTMLGDTIKVVDSIRIRDRMEVHDSPLRLDGLLCVQSQGVVNLHPVPYTNGVTVIRLTIGVVKKGEKSSIVIFWNMYTFKEKDEHGEEHERTVPLLRYYHVFEVGQCDDIRRKYNPKKPRHIDTIEEAEQVVDAYFAREACSLQNTIARNSAGYAPRLDVVVVPTIDQHVTAEDYYSTLFHEMTHSTGHSSRLNRPEINNFDITPYSREELGAEMGASFLSNILGIDTAKTHRNSVGYIQGWMSKLREDKRAFITAAGRAEAAVKYILHGRQPEPNGLE